LPDSQVELQTSRARAVPEQGARSTAETNAPLSI